MFNNKELTTALNQKLVFLDRIIVDYRGRMNQILLYLLILLSGFTVFVFENHDKDG
jgi:hypothetical protein